MQVSADLRKNEINKIGFDPSLNGIGSMPLQH